jgi:hypothetical protein
MLTIKDLITPENKVMMQRPGEEVNYEAYVMPTKGLKYQLSEDCFLSPDSDTDWIVCEAEDNGKISIMDEKTFWDCYDWSSTLQSDLDPVEEPVPDPDTFDPEHFDYENNYVLKEMIQCDCGTHAISIRADGAYLGELELAFWQYGHGQNKRSWKSRLKTIWEILTKGHSFADMILLSKEEQAKLVDVISKTDALHQKYTADHQRYLDYKRRTEKPKETFTLQEVAEFQADHDAEIKALTEVIETLASQIKPNP